jgi:hypothetical protein
MGAFVYPDKSTMFCRGSLVANELNASYSIDFLPSVNIVNRCLLTVMLTILTTAC